MPVMLRRLSLTVVLFTTAVLLTACASTPNRVDGGVSSRAGGTVISGAALQDGTGSVLDAMRGKVPSLKIQRYRGQCPKIALRNDATFQTVVEPHIYVDGARATDTCILESLRTHDVDRIEIYPTGVSGRPGYLSHAHGLILLFMRS